MRVNTILALVAGAGAMSLSACTAVDVQPVGQAYDIGHVCIEKNPKVIVADFIPVVSQCLQNHDITSELYSGKPPEYCQYKLTYTARRSWHMTPYLSYAELHLYELYQNTDYGKEIGSATYRLRGKGGLSVFKWDSVQTKMTPVVDALLN